LNHISTNPPPLAPILEFLRRHAPFDQMAPAHLEYLAKRLKLGFYARGQAVTRPEDGPANRFFIIKQGRVRGEIGSDEPDDEGAWELVTGESFPIGALLSRRPVRTINRAVEDTFCFELEREEFDTLLGQSPLFHDFCTRRLANLLDHALRSAQATSATRVSEDGSLGTPLGSLIQRPPIACQPDNPVGDGLVLMDREHIGSIIVVDGQQAPIGVFTLHDVLSRVALPQRDPDTPIAEVMTPAPLTLGPDARAYEAALLMAQHGFGHVCIVERGRLIGVVSERDLFSLQRVGLVSLSRAIARADTLETLRNVSANIHRLVEQMLAQGASVGQITEIITTLNDSVTRRAIILVLTETGKPPTPFNWLAFGSEGRGEQTLKIDQDNGILFHPPAGKSADEVRAELLPIAERINQALAQVGFPLCPRNVMAGNPAYCLSIGEWKQRFGNWIGESTQQSALNAAGHFDFRNLYGEPEAVEELRSWVLGQTGAGGRFCRQLTEEALSHRPPLGLFGDIKVSSGGQHPHTIDLKQQGLAPFVDAARLIALANGLAETNTVKRLRTAAALKVLPAADAEAWADSFHFIQLLRVRVHQRQSEQGAALSNHVDPDSLNELDRRILKEAFRQARKLQSRIALDYQL